MIRRPPRSTLFPTRRSSDLDGIQSRIDPGDPLDKNLYELPPEELANVPSVPDSLRGAIEALSEDHRSEEHTSELQSQSNLVCRLLLEKKKQNPSRASTAGMT